MDAGTIVQDVIAGVENLVEFIVSELGNFAHALALNVMHDIEKLGGDPTALTAVGLGDMWTTVKQQAATAWNTLVGDFEAKVMALTVMLRNINWKMVAQEIIDLSMPTLETLARVAAGMAVAGVLAL